MNTMDSIWMRKSSRDFIAEPVEGSKLSIIATAGAFAPYSGEIQLTVVTNFDCLKAIDDAVKAVLLVSKNKFLMAKAAEEDFSPTYHAPALIVLSVPESEDPTAVNLGYANAGCAAQNIMLAATDFELGSCCLASVDLAFHHTNLNILCDIPDGMMPVLTVAIGKTDNTEPHTVRQVKNINFRS